MIAPIASGPTDLCWRLSSLPEPAARSESHADCYLVYGRPLVLVRNKQSRLVGQIGAIPRQGGLSEGAAIVKDLTHI